MDLHHEIMVLLLDGALHTAPLYNPQRILDVGTGTGIWAVEMSVTCPTPSPTLGTDVLLQGREIPPGKGRRDGSQASSAYTRTSTGLLMHTSTQPPATKMGASKLCFRDRRRRAEVAISSC